MNTLEKIRKFKSNVFVEDFQIWMGNLKNALNENKI